MASLSDISRGEFENGLTPDRLRIGMFVQAALGIGTLTFFILVLVIALSHRTNEIDSGIIGLLSILTIVDLVVFVVLGSVAQIMYKSRFSPARLVSAMTEELRDQQGKPISATPVERAISFIRAGMLIRTAMFQASSFLGLTVLLLAAINNVLFTVPWLWMNAIPAATLLVSIAYTFPTSNRLTLIFETNILHLH